MPAGRANAVRGRRSGGGRNDEDDEFDIHSSVEHAATDHGSGSNICKPTGLPASGNSAVLAEIHGQREREVLLQPGDLSILQPTAGQWLCGSADPERYVWDQSGKHDASGARYHVSGAA